VVVDAIHNELSRSLVDERLELDSHRLHNALPKKFPLRQVSCA
jgi:hypothetical protein